MSYNFAIDCAEETRETINGVGAIFSAEISADQDPTF